MPQIGAITFSFVSHPLSIDDGIYLTGPLIFCRYNLEESNGTNSFYTVPCCDPQYTIHKGFIEIWFTCRRVSLQKLTIKIKPSCRSFILTLKLILILPKVFDLWLFHIFYLFIIIICFLHLFHIFYRFISISTWTIIFISTWSICSFRIIIICFVY